MNVLKQDRKGVFLGLRHNVENRVAEFKNGDKITENVEFL
jgi:hypothetical protein